MLVPKGCRKGGSKIHEARPGEVPARTIQDLESDAKFLIDPCQLSPRWPSLDPANILSNHRVYVI
jgi:hypothetical protein